MPRVRHQPEKTSLHELVREHLGTFLRVVEEETGRRLPTFVVNAWRSYLDCGLGGAGFRRLRCEDCHDETIVCFSCKTRQLCPSCGARHMADGAVHLVDKVIPEVAVRQYVLSLPFETWGVLGFRPALMNAVQRAFVECVQAWHQERAKEYGFPGGKTGGVAVLHRFNNSLMLMPHIHALVLDGVYTPDAVFHRFNAPDLAHLKSLALRLARRVQRILERAADESEEDDALRACTRAALQAGHRTSPDDAVGGLPPRGKAGKLAVDVDGFNLEATTVVAGDDRAALERMCRYLLRGPIALDRLHINDDGNAVYDLKRPDRHGRTTLVMTPHELMARMTAIIPAPNLCLRRTFGVLAPRSPLRKAVVPKPAPPPVHAPPRADATATAAPTRTPWRELLARVFRFDAMKCAKCGGPLGVVACIQDKAEARRYLDGTAQDADLPAQGATREADKPP